MTWSLRSCGLQDHLTSTIITITHFAVGDVNNATPRMRWQTDEAITMHVIAASIPNSVFTNTESKTTAKDVWDALKAFFEGRTTIALVKLSQQLQSTRCGKDDNVCEHIDKLANLCEQLVTMGESIPDNEYVSILMESLPMMYAGEAPRYSASESGRTELRDKDLERRLSA